jgi:putative oxidoreductase
MWNVRSPIVTWHSTGLYLRPVSGSSRCAHRITAIRKVHLRNGPWTTNGGYEYNLALIAALAALTETGPGRPSVDDALLPRFTGAGWALAAVAAGAAGSYLATERFNEPEAAPAPQEGQADVTGDPSLERQPRFTREPVEQPATS